MGTSVGQRGKTTHGKGAVKIRALSMCYSHFVPAPTLCSERLVIRPLTLDDAEPFHRIWGDPEVIFWGARESLQASREMLRVVVTEQSDDCMGWYAIELVDGGAMVGDVVLRAAPYREGELEIGWHVARAAQGRGYATEAAARVVRYAFEQLEAPRISCIVLPDNRASLRVAEKLGFVGAGMLVYRELEHVELVLQR